MLRKCNSLPTTLLILAIGVAYTLLGFCIIPLGDDVNFNIDYSQYGEGFYGFIEFCRWHMDSNNARISDFLTPIPIHYFAKWGRALYLGFIHVWMVGVMIPLALGKRSKNQFLSILLIFFIIFTLRWDGIWMEFVASNVYIFSTALSLSAIWLITHIRDFKYLNLLWIATPIFLIGGGMHEACGLPLSVGLISWMIIDNNWQKIGIKGVIFALLFFAGAVFTLFSDAHWNRSVTILQRESPIEMLLFSAGWVVMLISIIIALIIRKDWQILRSLLRSRWTIFAISSVASLPFMFVAGFGGRPGWFAQIFALIAIFQILRRLNLKLPQTSRRIVAGGLAILIILHLSSLVIWQHRLNHEIRDVIYLLKASTDGVVYYDFTEDSELPFYLLRKVHGVPDADDSYYLSTISWLHGGEKKIVVLPTKAETLNLTFGAKFNRKFISPTRLQGGYDGSILASFPRNMVKRNGIEYIETPFPYHGRTLYLYSPVDMDRGEK